MLRQVELLLRQFEIYLYIYSKCFLCSRKCERIDKLVYANFQIQLANLRNRVNIYTKFMNIKCWHLNETTN